jgi:chaperonin GroES
MEKIESMQDRKERRQYLESIIRLSPDLKLLPEDKEVHLSDNFREAFKYKYKEAVELLKKHKYVKLEELKEMSHDLNHLLSQVKYPMHRLIVDPDMVCLFKTKREQQREAIAAMVKLVLDNIDSNGAKRIVPLFDRVLIQREAAKTSEAVVVAVGPGARTEAGQTVPMSVAVGDKVLLPEFGGNKIEVDGEEFSMYRETDILAKLIK